MKLYIAIILCLGLVSVYARRHHSANSEVMKELRDMVVKHHRVHDQEIKEDENDNDDGEDDGEDDEEDENEQNNMGGLQGLLGGLLGGKGGENQGKPEPTKAVPAPTEPAQTEPPAPTEPAATGAPAPALCAPKPSTLSCHSVEKFCITHVPWMKTMCYGITKHCFKFCEKSFAGCTAKAMAAKSHYDTCYHRYVKCIY